MTGLLSRWTHSVVDVTAMTAEEILRWYAPTNSKERYGDWSRRHIDFEVGHATAELDSPHQCFRTIYSVHVHVGHRGQGHGRRLMEVITAYADAAGYGLSLEVVASNEPAMRLYASAGFKIVHTREPGERDLFRETTHWMQRYPTRIPATPEWDEHFEAKALLLERDHEPRLGSDHWVAFFDALYKAQMEDREDLGRARHTGSRNYEENTRRLSCDATGAALEAAGWTITRTNKEDV